MITPETNLEYVEALGVLPIRTSAVDSPYVAKNPELKKAVEALSASHGNPNVPGWVKMRDAMGQSLERALHGKLPPAEALKEAVTEVDKVIAAG